MAATAPLTEGLARCAGITAPDARLACYDALVRETSAEGVPAGEAAPVASASPPTTTPAPAMPAPSPSVVAAPETAVVQKPPAADTAQNFGLSPAQIHPTPVGPAAIEARLTGIAFNQGNFGQTYLSLDNGQLWKTRDDVARLAVGNPVKIKRAALGSFLLLDPANLSYRVYRVK
jgi:hypothetical protein